MLHHSRDWGVGVLYICPCMYMVHVHVHITLGGVAAGWYRGGGGSNQDLAAKEADKAAKFLNFLYILLKI